MKFVAIVFQHLQLIEKHFVPYSQIACVNGRELYDLINELHGKHV